MGSSFLVSFCFGWGWLKAENKSSSTLVLLVSSFLFSLGWLNAANKSSSLFLGSSFLAGCDEGKLLKKSFPFISYDIPLFSLLFKLFNKSLKSVFCLFSLFVCFTFSFWLLNNKSKLLFPFELVFLLSLLLGAVLVVFVVFDAAPKIESKSLFKLVFLLAALFPCFDSSTS